MDAEIFMLFQVASIATASLEEFLIATNREMVLGASQIIDPNVRV
jgi:hypothetical protein